jgi:Sulfotransferase domain
MASTSSLDTTSSQAPASASGQQPSALIVTIPEAGTDSLCNAFVRNFRLTTAVISNQYFPIDQLRLFETMHFAAGKRVAATHIDPSPINLQILEAFIQRWVVHLRDPRSVVLSWTQRVERLWREGRHHHLLFVTPSPDPIYHGMALEDRLSWQIKHFLPSVMGWINVWVHLADAHPDRILLTEFSELEADEKRFVEKVADFLGLTFATGGYTSAGEKAKSAEFDSHDIDKWRGALTLEHQQAFRDAIRPELASRFGWSM